MEARFGLHPVFGINAYAEWHYTPDDFIFRKGRHRTGAEEAKLTAALEKGANTKGDLLAALLAEQEWDLFLAAFSESHSVGHQLWHLHDPDHKRFDSSRREQVGDPVLRVYQALDAQIGRLADEAPDHALLLIYLSHGMGVSYDGTDLLDEVLERLDGMPSGANGAAVRGMVKPFLPRLRDVAIRIGIPDRIRFAISGWLRGDQAQARARRRFFHEPNNTVYSGIRLNLIGREPRGRVRPEDADQVCAELTRELMALVNADSGGPVVSAVHRLDQHHRRAADDCMPDLLIEWHRNAPIERVSSTRVGTVRTPYNRIRSGDHRPEGLLIAVGSDLEPGAELAPIRVEDIGLSLAARFGVELNDVDGTVVSWLAGPAVSREFAPALSTAAPLRGAEPAHPASCG
jgi:predicted AlkP superfamily phosphohydrolase/phosphomutase